MQHCSFIYIFKIPFYATKSSKAYHALFSLEWDDDKNKLIINGMNSINQGLLQTKWSTKDE